MSIFNVTNNDVQTLEASEYCYASKYCYANVPDRFKTEMQIWKYGWE